MIARFCKILGAMIVQCPHMQEKQVQVSPQLGRRYQEVNGPHEDSVITGSHVALILLGKSEAVTFLALLKSPWVGNTCSAAKAVFIKLRVVALAHVTTTL